MSLIHRIILRLSLALLPLIMLWALLFYLKIVREVNDETDDALEDYSELIISRVLNNQSLPDVANGWNSTYTLLPIDPAAATPGEEEYSDGLVFIPSKGEAEPSRILKTHFRNPQGEYLELTVSMPTFAHDDLKETILYWMIYLYIILIATIIVISTFVLRKSMRPLYILLNWLERYTPGDKHSIVPNDTKDTEFYKLNVAAQKAVDRSEDVYERQKQFIGNASHELQTPLAVISNRIDWMIDQMDLNELQLEEVLRLKDTVRQAVRLNKNLLLLTKVDNNQFSESVLVDMTALITETLQNLNEIYAYKQIRCQTDIDTKIHIRMNESLAHILVSNLLKNAFIHSPDNSEMRISADRHRFSVSNPGDAALDGNAVFERFYQGSKKEGSTGLGLALVKTIAGYYHFQVGYAFINHHHQFSVYWN